MKRAVGIRLVLALLLVGTPLSVAAGESAGRGSAAPDIEQKTSKKLNDAIEQLNAGHYDKARSVLMDLDFDLLSPYEHARVEHVLSAIAQAEGHYAEARDHL